MKIVDFGYYLNGKNTHFYYPPLNMLKLGINDLGESTKQRNLM
jgi:hypothetical protein